MSPQPNKSELRCGSLILLLVAGAVGLAVVAAAIGFAARATERPRGSPSEGAYRGSEPPARFTLPSFRLTSYRGTPVVDYLLGTEEQLRPLWTALQILPFLDSGQDSLHSAPLRIYGRNGVWVATLHAGADLSEENLLHDIRTALAAGDQTAR